MTALDGRGASRDEGGLAPSWVVWSKPALTVRGERTRQRILSGARALVERRAYERIAVSDIAKRSHTSVGTFYRYFDSKETLLVSLLSDCLWEMYQAARGSWHPDAPFLDNLRQTTQTYLLAYRRNKLLLKSGAEAAQASPQVRRLWTEMRSDLYAHMADRLSQDQKASSLEPLDAQTMMRALGAMVDGYAHRAFADEEFGPISDADLEQAAEVLARIWCRAVFGADTDFVIRAGAARQKSARKR